MQFGCCWWNLLTLCKNIFKIILSRKNTQPTKLNEHPRREKYDKHMNVNNTALYLVWRRWTDISWAVHWRISVRRLKICSMYVCYFLVLLLLLIYGDDEYRRRVSKSRGPAFCFSAFLCKMATKDPQNDTKTQQGNPEIKDRLTACAARTHTILTCWEERKYLLNRRIISDHGSS